MTVAAGVLSILFGVLHAFPAVATLGKPAAERGSGDTGAVPFWARMLFLDLAIATTVGGVLLLTGREPIGAIIASVGAIGVALIAIANGFWMHGRPTLRHHVVRGAVVVAIVVLCAAAL